MIASVSVVAQTEPWPPRAWSPWPWVTRARAFGSPGSTQASAGFMYMPSGKGSIQEPRRAMGSYMAAWSAPAKARRGQDGKERKHGPGWTELVDHHHRGAPDPGRRPALGVPPQPQGSGQPGPHRARDPRRL